MADLTVIILTMNEETNIVNCIQSVRAFAKRIVLIDSGSTDKTVELATELGAEVYKHKFESYASQFNWGLDNTNIDTRWVLRLDADEVITKELAEEMQQSMLEHAEDDVNGMILKLKEQFMGRWLMHGGSYPFEKLMLFKYGIGRIENRMMDEHTILKEGREIKLKSDGLHYGYKDITFFVQKHNWYALREVEDYILKNMNKNIDKLSDGKIKTKRRQKDLYYKMPLFIRPIVYFIYRYFFQLGFLDGKAGFLHLFFQTFWYRFLIDTLIYEYKRTGNCRHTTGALN